MAPTLVVALDAPLLQGPRPSGTMSRFHALWRSKPVRLGTRMRALGSRYGRSRFRVSQHALTPRPSTVLVLNRRFAPLLRHSGPAHQPRQISALRS